MKTPLMRLTEIEQGKSIEQILTEGIEAGKSLNQIASDLGIPYPTLHSWKQELGMSVKRSVTFSPQPDEELAPA